MRLYEDLKTIQTRLGVLQYLVACCLVALVASFWYIQVLRGRHYRQKAENIQSRRISIAAPRGRLLDREGRTLVENRPSFNLVVAPERGLNVDDTAVRLGRALRLGEAQFRERLARRSLFHPLLVKADATRAEVAALEARRLELPEARVEVVPLRSYPLATAAAHALGHVGEISEAQLRSKESVDLEPGDLVGQAGIESQYNRDLMGRDGRRRVIVNSRGMEVAETERTAPSEGPSFTLTLDADLQKAMDRAFGGRAGCAVALDPATGEILGMTSIPAFDPNQFTTGLDAAGWKRLSTDTSNPLMDRVIQGQYAPGSLFKVVMAVAGLEEGIVTPETTVYCPGYLSIYNTVFRCNQAAGHGMVSLKRALAESCNVYFYQLGVRLEIDRIARYATKMGFGRPTGVDLPEEKAGLVPSPEWKMKVQKAPWYGGETVSVAIGQGQLTVTCLQMARLAALIANKGRLVHPHLAKAVAGKPIPECSTDGTGPCWWTPVDVGFRPETIQTVAEGMRGVVEGGTGWRARLPGVSVCGKTGSAQVVAHGRLARGGGEAIQPHGWFMAFAPADQPRIALAVLVEHGGSGGESAAPVAREILAHFFGRTATRVPGLAPKDIEG